MSTDFSVLALIAAYNEADIIEQVISDLIEQGVGIYFMDDGSTDGTLAAVERYRGKGVIGIEHLPDTLGSASAGGFEWERILARKAQLAQDLDATWFVHHDADEFRESPWPHDSMKEAIRRVDGLGFNAIDSVRFDFWPTHNEFRPGDDIRAAFTCYAPPAPYDRLQIRCWKKTDELVDLVSSGGHEARFSGRVVFPVPFILRHYPIRSQAHGERKVFRERRTRFRASERARGWHIQYDAIHEGESLIRDRSTLTPFNPDAIRLGLMLRHRGVQELEASLDTVRSEVDALRRELLGTQTQLEARDADVMESKQELQRRDDEIAELHNCLEHRRNDVIQLKQELERRDDEVAELRNDLEHRRDEVTGLQQNLQRQCAEVERLQLTVEGCLRSLDDFHQSRSWRLTAPARAVFRLLGGR